LLARWRRGRDASPAPDGCDPAVFADQVAEYLAEAAAARAQLQADDEPIADEPTFDEPTFDEPIARQPITVQPIALQPIARQPIAVQAIVVQPLAIHPSAPEPVAVDPIVNDFVDEPIVSERIVDEPIAAVARNEPVFAFRDASSETELHSGAAPDDEEDDIDLSGELSELSDDETGEPDATSDETELFDGEPVGVYTMPALTDAPIVEPLALEEHVVEPHVIEDRVEEDVIESVIDEMAAASRAVRPRAIAARAIEPTFVEQRPVAQRVIEEAVDLLAEFGDPTAADHADADAWVSAALARPHLWPTLEGVPAEIVVEAPRPVAAPARERSEWTELIASLRQDIERRRAEPMAAPKSAAAIVTPQKPRRPAAKAKPVQDEWGFFDPEQCGFAALLAKLDEITDGPDERDAPRH
jgi:hypothetical protein